MSMPSALNRPGGVPLQRRVTAKLAVGLTYLLTPLPPRRIRSILALLRRGATPATYVQALDARDAVLASSLSCLGTQGCLRRSLATVLLCRMSGRWPTWCVGARMLPPFGVHAWVEAEGSLVDEDVPDSYFSRLMAVPPKDHTTA
ncbi:MAG: lasso peptide biosynthesis B2 protein [Pseudonocardiaceae bacterium]|nr:lasso peptide biosynthesis B2 protein [Pseudonocardiaceae bacterium]